MIGDSCHCLLYLTYGLVFCPLYLVHTRLLLSVLNQPAVKKVLSSKPYNPTCPSSERTTGPTAEDSSSPVDKREKPLPPERREASDSNNDQVRGQSDKKSEKDS